ncbi:MAG: hypothetical protein HY561_02475 [Gemmatimonadetes bacterium]|nr:hypothetical protein [Gemmatimonadota bacterium]
MMRRAGLLGLLIAAVLLVGGACTGRATSTAPTPGEAPEARVQRVLAEAPLRPEQYQRIAELEAELGGALDELLTTVALDTTAPVFSRGNALLLLGERHAAAQLRAFRVALGAREPRVRAAAVVGLRGVLPLAPAKTVALLERALRDPETQVQARALESLGDTDAAVLRRYLAGTPPTQLRAVAEELLRVVEERGAPLGAPAESGTLERVGPGGARLLFRPLRQWPQWEAAVGELHVGTPGRPPTLVAKDVEMVAYVVPAFFSSDGRYLVYESARQIRVRDLESGNERALGPGIAPRGFPFTDDLLFLRERPDASVRQGDDVVLSYQVLRAPFAGGEPTSLGELTAIVRGQRRGAYSPARWMRVREQEGVIYLEGEDVSSFRLPDPFLSQNTAP